MQVEFTTDDGRTVRGSIARLNRQTATVLADAGSWRVSPSLLRVVDAVDTQARPTSRIVSMPPRRRSR